MATGKVMIFIGIAFLLLGVTMNYAPWLINWFGKLPGDIHIQNEKSTLYFPVVSMLIISVILSLIVNLFFRK